MRLSTTAPGHNNTLTRDKGRLPSGQASRTEARLFIFEYSAICLQSHHHRREVFLTGVEMTASVGTLLLPAEIRLSLKSFQQASGHGDDIFLCR